MDWLLMVEYDWGDGTVTNSYQDEDGNWLDFED